MINIENQKDYQAVYPGQKEVEDKDVIVGDNGSAVFDTATGQARYDNYSGRWGDQQHLDAFLQAYAVERTKIEARRKAFFFIGVSGCSR